MQEYEAFNQTFRLLQNQLKEVLDFLAKALDILLKDKEKLSDELIKEYEKDKKVIDIFTEYLNGKGLVVPFVVSENDKVLIEQALNQNEKAFLDSKDKNDKEFITTFDNKHFAFEHYFHKNTDNSYMLLLKDRDVSKLKDLKEYLDKNFPDNQIELFKKDIKNLLSIDNSKPLNTLDVFNSSYKEIASILNAYKVPFEVANMEQDMVKIIYERDYLNEVNRALRNADISDKEMAYYISNSKEFNNREEAKNKVNEMLNEKPNIDKLLNETKAEKDGNGRE